MRTEECFDHWFHYHLFQGIFSPELIHSSLWRNINVHSSTTHISLCSNKYIVLWTLSLSHQIECCVLNQKRTYGELSLHQCPKQHLSPTNPQLTNNSQNNSQNHIHQTTHISNKMCTHSNTNSSSAGSFTLSHRVSTVPACRYCFRTLSWNPLLRRWNCQPCHLYF